MFKAKKKCQNFSTENCQFIPQLKSTMQEMCCGFLMSREMWYRKLVLPSTGAGRLKIKIDEKMKNILFVKFYMENPLSMGSEISPIKCINISSI